jgi:hypothetical protein
MPKSLLDWFGVVSLWVGGLVFAIKSADAPLLTGAPTLFAANFWNFVPLALVSVAIVIFLYRLNNPLANVAGVIRESTLELRTYGAGRTPTGVVTENIWRWYTLNTVAQVPPNSNVTTQATQHIFTTLFVTFDEHSETRNLAVASPDMTLPTYEVKDLNQKSAIIVFHGSLGPGTLTVRAHR